MCRPLLIALALALVLAGCGGETTVQPVPETVVGTTPATTMPEGDAEAGLDVYESSGCGSCHTVAEAGSTSEVGPNLDESLQGKDAAYIRESIVNPNAVIAPGFQPGIMPQDVSTRLSGQEIADLVAFLSQES